MRKASLHSPFAYSNSANDANGDDNGWLASDGYDDLAFTLQSRICHDLGRSGIWFVLYVDDDLFRQCRYCSPDVAADLQLVLHSSPLRCAGGPVVHVDLWCNFAVDYFDFPNGHDCTYARHDLDDNADVFDGSYLNLFNSYIGFYPDGHAIHVDVYCCTGPKLHDVHSAVEHQRDVKRYGHKSELCCGADFLFVHAFVDDLDRTPKHHDKCAYERCVDEPIFIYRLDLRGSFFEHTDEFVAHIVDSYGFIDADGCSGSNFYQLDDGYYYEHFTRTRYIVADYLNGACAFVEHGVS
ncbi:hypothetical protein [Aureimonas sp. Leaf324]|uniref:hypothetical protein n=1 Tax=Aureimonas sp. Leaf324 TaxID=1736336 RepID=UPI0006F90C83|nr:hypothetical protein [Aureimonas sp. Leaf324]KQQ90237.1 hypothetical protein ASF65_15405 [Aureimonas sp. Leaf324]